MYAQAALLSAQLWCLINCSSMMLLLFQLVVEETREQRDTRGERRASLVLPTREAKVNNMQHAPHTECGNTEREVSPSKLRYVEQGDLWELGAGREMRAWFL